jgi:predicted amidohydrolase
MAKDRNSHIAGSLIIKEKNLHFNRLYFVGPNGYLAHYDKRHLFRMGREQEFFSRGSERVIVSLGKFRILLQICYDLRFPVFARNRGDYDVILYVANWPTKRAFVWDSLLVARAIENQSYVIGANRSGIDGLGDGTCGKSCVIDAKGKKIARMQRAPGILISNLNLNSLNIFRKKFPVLQDRDDFEIKS